MDLGLKGKVVFVSGGSRGIGFSIAAAFAAEGAKVAIAARSAESLEQAGMRLAETAGEKRVEAIQADMTSEPDIIRALDETEAQLGSIFAVVANVGTGTARPGYELDRAAWQGPIEANLLGSVLLAGAVLPRLVTRRGGNLTFISSIAGIEVVKAPIPYSVAKAGLLMAMKSYAHEVGRYNVRVNAVAPGNVFFPGGSWSEKFLDPEKKIIFENYIRSEVALRRFATPKEIADTVVFMASDRAGFMTGSVVVVDGGQTRSLN